MQYGRILENNNFEITKSNITYVPIDGDISTYITNATAGDTLVLAAGTYGITADIEIGKSITLTGQGVNQTKITTATVGINPIHISTTSDVCISNLSVNATWGSSQGFPIRALNSTNILIDKVNINVTLTSSAATWALYAVGSDIVVRDTYITIVNSGLSTGHGVMATTDTNSTRNATVDCYNVTVYSMPSGLANAAAFAAYNGEVTYVATLNLYNCSSTCWSRGVSVQSGSPFTYNVAKVNAYNCTFTGAQADAWQNATNTITLYDCTLTNNLTTGTITYAGTIRSKHFQTTGPLWATKYTCTVTLDWNNSNVQYIQLTSGDQTFTFANPKDGALYSLVLKQPASGAAGTATWPTVAWPGAITPTLTTINGHYDIITFVYDGTNSKYYGGISYDYV